MPHNLLNEMLQDRTIERILAPHMGEMVTPKIMQRLAHALVYENYMRRLSESRLTGEWIIFSKNVGANYYITLAGHREGDALVAERLRRYEDLDRESGWKSGRGITLNVTESPMVEPAPKTPERA